MNVCQFSEDRVYRYTLRHQWDESEKMLAVVGLNPSTADEQTLDPTLRKVRGFAQRWGYGGFVMLNLFAFRATQPRVMLKADDPVGPDNDHWIRTVIESPHVEGILLAWGGGGTFRRRDREVMAIVGKHPHWALKLNDDGSPMHPLYARYDNPPVKFDGMPEGLT